MIEEILMLKKVFSMVFLLSIVFSFGGFAFAQDTSERTLTVNGSGEVMVKPDVAFINVAVITKARTAEAALKNNANRTSEVLKKIKSMIGKEDKATTSGFNLAPVYEYNQSTKKSDLTGYSVTNELKVKTMDLAGIGTLIDSVTNVGANRINGPIFDIKDKDKYKKEALRLAVKDARETANVVAEAAGVTLVQVIQVNPSYIQPMPVYGRGQFEAMKVASDQAPTPIESGEIPVRANVNMSFQIQ